MHTETAAEMRGLLNGKARTMTRRYQCRTGAYGLVLMLASSLASADPPPAMHPPAPEVKDNTPAVENLPLQNWLDPQVRSASFFVWYGKNPEPVLELLSPRGRIIKYNDPESGSDVSFLATPEFQNKGISISKPEPGKWQVLINGSPSLPDESYSVSYLLEVENELVIEPRFFYSQTTGLAWVFSAFLEDRKMPTGAMELSSYYSADSEESVHPLSFNDAGLGQDQVARDGVFTSEIWKPPTYDSYEIVAWIKGRMDGHPFLRQAFISFYLYYHLDPIPVLETGKVYQIVIEEDGKAYTYFKMRVLDISSDGRVLVERFGGALGKEVVRSHFDFWFLVATPTARIHPDAAPRATGPAER